MALTVSVLPRRDRERRRADLSVIAGSFFDLADASGEEWYCDRAASWLTWMMLHDPLGIAA